MTDAPDVVRMSTTDYEAHEQTFTTFLWLTKWAVITISVVLILMWLFLT